MDEVNRKLSFNFSLLPSFSFTSEKKGFSFSDSTDTNSAVRFLKYLDSLIPDEEIIPVILDEIETLSSDNRAQLAHLIKQIGDQNFNLKLILVGIGENVQELIGEHRSVPRYISEIKLTPLSPQDLIDIVKKAAEAVHVTVPDDICKGIAIVGNGYPHFAHLLGKYLLFEAVKSNEAVVTKDIYKRGLDKAVLNSIQELTISYNEATQRGDDINRDLLWSLADYNSTDIRVDDWISHYNEFCKRIRIAPIEEKELKTRISRLSTSEFGSIIRNTPLSYGSREIRYRYKRFTNSLMKGHIRLIAETEGIRLGTI